MPRKHNISSSKKLRQQNERDDRSSAKRRGALVYKHASIALTLLRDLLYFVYFVDELVLCANEQDNY